MSTLEPQAERVVVPHEEHQFNFTRLFASDLRRDGLIPAALLGHPELAALEAERARLAAALDEAEQGGGGGYLTDEQYVAVRSAALREGRTLPPPPPTATKVAADNENRRRNVAAAEDALLSLGETLRRTIAAHPEWQDEAAEKVKAARAEAAELMRQARQAEVRAQEAEHYERWLRRASDGEVYYPTFVENSGQPQDEPDLIWNITDPYIIDLIASSRTGQPL